MRGVTPALVHDISALTVVSPSATVKLPDLGFATLNIYETPQCLQTHQVPHLS